MTEYLDHNIKITVNIPISKEVFEAWEQLDGYQDYLLEDFDAFLYHALNKSYTRSEINNYIKTAIYLTQSTIRNIDNEWIESRDGMEA